jgi:predicted HTH transcriptional regulator
LRTLGFKNVENDLFIENSYYFRNSLVRANYGASKTTKYLVKFLENLLLGAKNVLKNKELRIDFTDTEKSLIDTIKTQVSDDETDPLNDKTAHAVFVVICENVYITAEEIKDKFKISLATAKRKIKMLKDGGYIKRVGSVKSGYWKVLKRG